MANGFVADAVLLPSKGERCERCQLEVGDRAKLVIQDVGTNPQREVAQVEHTAQCLIGRTKVFARAKEKEVANHEHVGAGGDRGFVAGQMDGVDEER